MTTWLHRLRRDRCGAALIEFALALPILLTLGGFGIELANFAIVNMRVSQIALTTADNASRFGVGKDNQIPYQVQEADVNDALLGAQLMGAGFNLARFGRVTISSLENIQRQFSDAPQDAQPVQRLHWQRCTGAMAGYPPSGSTIPVYDSSDAAATGLTTAATDQTKANAGPNQASLRGVPPAVPSAPAGSAPAAVTAPTGIGVIFVEINYQYQPVFGQMFMGNKKIHQTASYMVRDNRDYRQLFNTTTKLGSPSRATCDKHAETMPKL